MSKTFEQMLAEVPADKLEEVKKYHVIYAGKIWTKADFDAFCKEINLSIGSPVHISEIDDPML